MTWSCPLLGGRVLLAVCWALFSSGSNRRSIALFLCRLCWFVVLICFPYGHIQEYKFALKADCYVHNHNLVLLDRHQVELENFILLTSEMWVVIHYPTFLLSFASQGSPQLVVVFVASTLHRWADAQVVEQSSHFSAVWNCANNSANLVAVSEYFLKLQDSSVNVGLEI